MFLLVLLQIIPQGMEAKGKEENKEQKHLGTFIKNMSKMK